ncbi:MAG: sulfotransferase domain-containing protein [Methylovirgula sp.]|uniref:sulfotransferase domain-containing protein n=1 Tax=Methylovirgula sp. TaxID=1978224 RepID=UPI0030764CAD
MIVWLASYPRSGNTLLRTLLLRCFELNTYSLYDDSGDIGACPELRSAVGHVNHGLDQKKFYKQAKRSNEIFFVKTHDAPRDNAKAIYVVRDGRSAIISYYHYMRNFASSATVSARGIVVGECLFGSWGEHLKQWTPMERHDTLLLKYDDLLSNPYKVVENVSSFIGRPIVRVSFPSFADLKSTNANFFRCGNDIENIEQLQGDDLDLFWRMHGDLMLKYGFPHSVPTSS